MQRRRRRRIHTSPNPLPVFHAQPDARFKCFHILVQIFALVLNSSPPVQKITFFFRVFNSDLCFLSLFLLFSSPPSLPFYVGGCLGQILFPSLLLFLSSFPTSLSLFASFCGDKKTFFPFPRWREKERESEKGENTAERRERKDVSVLFCLGLFCSKTDKVNLPYTCTTGRHMYLRTGSIINSPARWLPWRGISAALACRSGRTGRTPARPCTTWASRACRPPCRSRTSASLPPSPVRAGGRRSAAGEGSERLEKKIR